ncbi:hypothetical protein GCM10018963_12680 [Saccharothrix longispora]
MLFNVVSSLGQDVRNIPVTRWFAPGFRLSLGGPPGSATAAPRPRGRKGAPYMPPGAPRAHCDRILAATGKARGRADRNSRTRFEFHPTPSASNGFGCSSGLLRRTFGPVSAGGAGGPVPGAAAGGPRPAGPAGRAQG